MESARQRVTASPRQVLNPPEDFGNDAMRAHGKDVYERSCTGCHEGGRMFTGYPDLNYTMALNSAPLFKAIVLDGALKENGMMPFNKSLSAEDAEAIRSYLTVRANELKKNPSARFVSDGDPNVVSVPAASEGDVRQRFRSRVHVVR